MSDRVFRRIVGDHIILKKFPFNISQLYLAGENRNKNTSIYSEYILVPTIFGTIFIIYFERKISFREIKYKILFIFFCGNV